MNLPAALRIPPRARIDLARLSTSFTHDIAEGDKADKRLAKLVDRIGKLVHTLGADKRFALLVILQGMDTSGKDGAIRRIFHSVDPQLMRVETFKRPTEEELAHDYLWRVHPKTPRRGELVVFNRSHYEDVGIVRVHNLAPKEVWSKRYDHINAFEQLLTDSGTVVLKFFLHISKAEQRERLKARLDDPSKNWKMDLADLAERKRWPAYMDAYSAAISKCSTLHAPWHIIPADHKWFRNYAIASVVELALADLHLRYPKPAFDPGKIKIV